MSSQKRRRLDAGKCLAVVVVMSLVCGFSPARSAAQSAALTPPATIMPTAEPTEKAPPAEPWASGAPSPRETVEIDRVRAQIFLRRESGPLRADVYLPRGDGPFPGVLLIHGGGWRMGTRWTMSNYGNAAVRRGYVAVAIDYRLAPEHRFPAPLEDCRAAVRWMKRQAPQWNMDADRIGAWGYSAGGHLAALLGVCEDQLEDGLGCRVQAVVAGGAPCSFLTLDEDNRMFAYFLGGSRAERPESYRLASPSWFASADDPPVLFVHGATDFLVPKSNAQELFSRLQRCGVRTRFHEVAECGHVGAFLAPSALQASFEFLDDALAPASDQPAASVAPPDTTGSDTTGSDTTGSDTTGSDTTGSDTTGSDISDGEQPRRFPLDA